jgi:hypothetical protein
MIFSVKQVLNQYTLSEDYLKIAKRNLHPEAVSFCYLKLDKTNRWVTGYTKGYYDDNYETEILEEKQSLETQAGLKFDVSNVDDPFLSLLKIDRALPNNRMPIYDVDDPIDLFKYRTAIASGFIAPRKEDVGVGIYTNTNYYFESEIVENKKENNISKLRVNVSNILSKNENERAWLVIQCFLHKFVVKANMENETLFAFLAKIIENSKTIPELQEVERVFKKKHQDIESNFIAKKALELNLITFDSITRDYIYQESPDDPSSSLGNSIQDVEAYLTNAKKNPVYAGIRKKVYNIYKIE